jgi:hypothetical protein
VKIRPGKYDYMMLGVAGAVWAYVLSWILQSSFWVSAIAHGRQARLSFETLETIFGVTYLVLTAFSVAAVVTHFCVLFWPSLRARFLPTLLGHVAFFALLLIGFGEVVTICSKPFPYLH